MNKKIGLFWLRDDFRITKNDGLIEATINHDQVVVFYLYKEETYKDQEAQKWWLSKSLSNFKKKLDSLKINLEIVGSNSFKIFFDELVKKQDFTIYWNKVYEPEYLKFDKYLSNILENRNISFKRLKEILLMRLTKLKKMMAVLLKYSPLFGEMQKNIILRKFHQKKKKLKHVKKKLTILRIA